MNRLVFTVEELKNFGRKCFQRVGVQDEDAVWTVEVLLKAELQGRSSHGISRLSAYINGIHRGKINPTPNIDVQRYTPVTSVINGDDGLGPVVAKVGIDSAIESAHELGVAASSVNHGNHAGALGIYVSRAADKGLVAIALTNAQPAIPPWGGRKAYFGTNPIAMAAGQGETQVVVDLATSIAARGNIILAAKSGDSIPEGWALDSDGNPTTVAAEALAGAVLPMAGPKGYSLALMVEILSGVLSGAAIGSQVGSIYNETPGSPNTGMFFLVLNPKMFVGTESFAERLRSMEEMIHSIPTTPDADYIYLPGERRREMEHQRMSQGIELSNQTVEELFSLAERLQVPSPQMVEK